MPVETLKPSPKLKTEKISDFIIAQIRDLIFSGELKPGDRLGSEKELIPRFGVSKATLREALRVLEAMGLVEIHGELWSARADQEIRAGERIRVTGLDALKITVTRE